MQFDPHQHRCTLIIDNQLPTGLALNAASVIGISFGKLVDHIVGPDLQSEDGFNYPGVIYAPLPVLLAEGGYLRELQRQATRTQRSSPCRLVRWRSLVRPTRSMASELPAPTVTILSWLQLV